jgi:prolipoprotein diacylglyceryltransferase
VLPFIEVPLVGPVQAHDAFVASSALVAACLGVYWSVTSERLPWRRVAAALMVLGGIVFVGGRTHFVAARWHLFSDEPLRALAISSAGLHAPGAILGAVVGFWASSRLVGLPVARLADGFAPAVGIGVAIARMGCLFNGCCMGQRCDLPWGLSLSARSDVWYSQAALGLIPIDSTHALPVHPLPLYFALAGLAISMILLKLRPSRKFPGELTLWLLFLFSLSSAVLEPFRGDHGLRVYWLGVPQLLWVASGMTVLAGSGLLYSKGRTSGAVARAGVGD